MDTDPASASGALDSTGKGREAQFNGSMDSADLVDGQVGKGTAMDGTDDVLSVQNFPLSAGYDKLSAQIWFKTTTDGIILTWDRNEYFRIENGGSQSNGNLGTSFYAGGATIDVLNAPSPYTDGAWHRATFVYDQGSVFLFVEGSKVDTETQGSQIGSGTERHGLFGDNSEEASDGSPSSLTPSFGGVLDESRVIFEALSAEEIAASYENEASPGSYLSVTEGTTWNLGRKSRTSTSLTIDVRYEPYAEATEIELQRASSQGGAYSTVKTFSAPALLQEYQDGSLSGGTTYWYRARALDSGGNVIRTSGEESFQTET